MGGRREGLARSRVRARAACRRRWREIGRLPEPTAYGVSLTIDEGVLIIGGGNATSNFSAVSLMSADAAGVLPFPAPVTLPAVAWNDGFALVSGKIRPGVRTPQVLLFRPGR